MRAPSSPSITYRRRGITLIEMVVALGLLVLMMSILVGVFQACTGSVSAQRAYAAIDADLRRLDSVIRQDLAGVTAKMTPPNDPKMNQGYFEYAENVFADAQGEDTDDTLRFTARAPSGHPFIGRIWVPSTSNPALILPYANLRPVQVSSEYAEIIYFLRNNRLYRRVLLILPGRVNTLGIGNYNPDANGKPQSFAFRTDLFTPYAAFPATLTAGGLPIVGFHGMNDVSVRPRRFDLAAFVSVQDSYTPTPNTLGDLTERHYRFFNPTWVDDYRSPNGTLVPDALPDDMNQDGVPDYVPTLYYSNGNINNGLLYEFDQTGNLALTPRLANPDTMAFPYIFPGSFSVPDATSTTLGWLHGMPSVAGIVNHAPLDTGDSLAIPDPTNTAQLQTWYGFPTWRETASPNWLAPFKRLNDPTGSPYFGGLPGTGIATADQPNHQAPGLSWVTPFPLPYQLNDPFANSAAGSNWFTMPTAVYEDDLLATNVRSFDVKAYDPNAYYFLDVNNNLLPPGYYDLGYYATPLLSAFIPGALETFGHEGRMPPLTIDGRVDSQYPLRGGTGSIADDNSNVLRLRRVWDSWSTSYTQVPGTTANPLHGPLVGLPSTYPSYPPPYPAPLRGIQIQLRVTDGSAQRVKTLTIRADFNDKL